MAYYVVHRFHAVLRAASLNLFTALHLPFAFIPRFEQALIYASLLFFVIRGVRKVGQLDLFPSKTAFVTTIMAQSIVWAAWIDHAEHYSEWRYEPHFFSWLGATALCTVLFVAEFLTFTWLGSRRLITGPLIDRPTPRFLFAMALVTLLEAILFAVMALQGNAMESVKMTIFLIIPPLLYLNPKRVRQLAALLVTIYVLAYLCIPLDSLFHAIETAARPDGR